MYKLFIANKNYSSWSLRPWVLMTELGIPFKEFITPFSPDSNRETFGGFSPTATVPCLHHEDIVVWDSLAIVEYLADNHSGVWPSESKTRAWARCAAAEMHSGFSTLRSNCGMIVGIRVELNEINTTLEQDIKRIDELWSDGLNQFSGPFLAGDSFTAVDAFYAPVVYRVRTYNLQLSQPSQDYVEMMLKNSSMQKWEQAALAEPWIDQEHDDEVRSFGAITEDFRQITN